MSVDTYREATVDLSNRDKLLEAERLISEVGGSLYGSWDAVPSVGTLNYVRGEILKVVGNL